MNVHGTNLDSALVPVPGAASFKQAIDGTAAALPALADGTKVLFWTIDGGVARVLFGGNVPTATDGHKLADGQGGAWSRDTASTAQLISVSGSPVFHGSQME